MCEVFTIGGGEYVVNTMNAVAAWTGNGGFRSLLRVVMVMGLIYSLCVMAFNLEWRSTFRWFLQTTLIYACLMVPTVTVRVTDRVNPGLAPSTVANVPLGLGVMASFTSQMSDWLVRQAETVFVMPGALQYSNGGIVYGAKMWEKVNTFEFKDPVFKYNLDTYMKNCVFMDIVMGLRSLKTLQDSTNLWADIGTNAAVNRGVKYMVDNGATADFVGMTCQGAYNAMNAYLVGAEPAEIQQFAQMVFADKPPATALAKLNADVPVIGNFATGNGQAANQLFRQKSVIDAFAQAQTNFGNDEADIFAAHRAEVQARNVFVGVTEKAMTWVPILQIVLTIVFYAMFPVLFPLFLFPNTGLATLKGYLSGFFYLAAWGPLYVLLHMFVMDRFASEMQSVANGGMTLNNFAGIQAVNSDTATIAGFMMMSVPVLAGMLARGAMAASSSAASWLAPVQSGAEASAVERTTGNYAFGNTSYENLTANNKQMGQWLTAPSLTDGAMKHSTRLNDGRIASQHGDGRTVYDTSGAIQRLPFSATYSTGNLAQLRQSADWHDMVADRKEQQLSNSRSQSQSSSESWGVSDATTTGRRKENGSESRQSQESGTFERGEFTSASGGRFTEGSGTTKSDTFTQTDGFQSSDVVGAKGSLNGILGGKAQITGGAKGEAGTPGKGIIGSGGDGYVDTSATGYGEVNTQGSLYKDGNQTRSEGFNSQTVTGTDKTTRGEEYLDASNRDSRGNTKGTSESSGTFSRDSGYSDTSTTRSHGTTDEARDTQEETLRNQIAWHREQAKSLRSEASFAETHDWRVSSQLDNMVYDRYNQLRNERPELAGLPDITDPNLTYEQMQRRNAGIELAIGDVIKDVSSKRPTSFDSAQPFGPDAGKPISFPSQSLDRSELPNVGGPSIPKKKGDSSIDIADAGTGPGSFTGPPTSRLSGSGEGYYTYDRADHRYGNQSTVNELRASSGLWAQAGGTPVGIGDLGKRGGGDTSRHDGHERGNEVDIRPFRADQSRGPVTWQDPNYDRDQTREYIRFMKERNPGLTVLFNDPVLIKEGLTKKWRDHDNHMHLKFKR